MVGGLEVLQNETTCHTQLALCGGIERLAGDVSGEVREVIFRLVSPV